MGEWILGGKGVGSQMEARVADREQRAATTAGILPSWGAALLRPYMMVAWAEVATGVWRIRIWLV
jgi:hypothetical protein